MKNKIPYIDGIKKCDTDTLKSLGAAMAASGGIALYHIKNITPESGKYSDLKLEKIEFTENELKKSYEELTDIDTIDLVVVGCPHASLSEIRRIADKLKNKKLRNDFWVCTSKSIKIWSDKMDYTKIIENAGGKIICDTCMVVSPLEELDYKNIGTNSGKAAKYLPGFCKKKVFFSDLDTLIEMSIKK